jgi:NADH-quinone oxidoreductase subunit J
MQLFFFFLFAIITIIATVGVISVKNIVHSALFLLLTFFCMASLFVLLKAEFVAAIQILVYAGAIMVLFIFVILLINVEKNALMVQVHKQKPLVLVFSFFILLEIVFVISKFVLSSTLGENTVEQMNKFGNTEVVSLALFTKFFFPFEIASLLLLAAMIGGIILASDKPLHKSKKDIH